MAMDTLERDTLAKSFAVCKQLILDIQPKLAALKQIYDSENGVKATLTQDDLDTEPALSGLTKQQVDDGLYALTTVLLPAIEQGYPSLATIAARFL